MCVYDRLTSQHVDHVWSEKNLIYLYRNEVLIRYLFIYFSLSFPHLVTQDTQSDCVWINNCTKIENRAESQLTLAPFTSHFLSLVPQRETEDTDKPKTRDKLDSDADRVLLL